MDYAAQPLGDMRRGLGVEGADLDVDRQRGLPRRANSPTMRGRTSGSGAASTA
jgi:hypothetical protein